MKPTDYNRSRQDSLKQRAQANARKKASQASQKKSAYVPDDVYAPPPNKPKSKRPSPFSHKDYPGRFKLVFFILALMGAVIVGKLFFVQLINAGELQKKARQSRNQSLSLFNRGRILDKNGITLAQDTFLYDLYAHPQYYFKIEPKQMAKALAPILSISEPKLLKKLQQPYSTISLKKNITKAMVDKINDARIELPLIDDETGKQAIDEETGKLLTKQVKVPGLDFSKKPVRNYPQGSLAAHVLGYVNDEAGISSGIEETASPVLKKEPDQVMGTILNGRGDVVSVEKLSPEALVNIPKADDIRLTLDSKLQYVAERELAKGVARSKAKRGSVIMMRPDTGEILAFAVYPTYQPDQFHKADAQTLKNWAISDVYPPGSTFKILTVASGIETGVIDKNSIINDTGKMVVGGWTIRNYDYGRRGAPGNIDLIYLLQHSSNIGSAKISLMMNQTEQAKILSNFGIGSKTHIDLPGESQGIFNTETKWDSSTHASIGYGYGMASTPIQMASAVASIANGGVWVTPHLIKNRADIETRRVLSEKTATTVRELLTRSIMTAGRSTVRVGDMDVGGKTGTSKKPNDSGRGYTNQIYTSFAGFFPAAKPEIVMMVVIDSPTMAESWGSTVAGPIFHAIADETIRYLGLKPAKLWPKAKSDGH